MKTTWTISRVTDAQFSAVSSDIWMTDGSTRRDLDMRLDGNVLRSHEGGGYRVGGLLRLTLGDVSLSAVRALAVGESVTL